MRQNGARYFKKGDGVFRERVSVKYTWIDRNKTQWPITLACEVLGVSASGYFQHQRRKKSVAVNNVTGLTRLSDGALLVQIRTIHAEVRQEYGCPRMTRELNARGFRGGQRTGSQADEDQWHQSQG